MSFVRPCFSTQLKCGKIFYKLNENLMKYFSTSIRHSNQAGLPPACAGMAQAGRTTIGIFTAIAMVVQLAGPVALLIPQTANAIVPVVFSESFGSGNDLADIPDWDEHEDGSIAKNPDGYIEDTASPDGGRFAKIAEDTNDSGSEDGWVCREVDVTGYESLELSYYWRGDKDSDDSSDDGLVQYKEGSGSCDGTTDWNELKKHDIRDDSSWTFQDSFNLPNSLDDSVFRLRFYNDSATADNNEFFRVDGIEITGNVIEEDDKPGTGSIDNECQAYGFDFGIAKWEWDDEKGEYVLEDGYNEDYETSVTGDASEADWTSDPVADGVLSKEGQDYQNLPGGTDGTVVKGGHDISHITLCGNEGEPEPEPICEIGVNLIENSGFETPVVTDDEKWDIFDSGTAGLGWLVNWMASVTDPAPDIAKLELHQGVNGWTSNSGEQHAELDTDWQGPGGPSGEQASVAIYQDIPTVPGREYKLSFSFSPRPDTDSSENVLGILWDGVLEDTVTAAGGGNTSWTDHEYTFVAADNSTKLEFQDQGTPNSLGTFLDDVSLECLPECNPAEMVVVSDSDMMVWRDIEDTPAVPLTFRHPAWTADVGDPSAQWVWEEDGVGDPEATEYYTFYKTFDIPGDVTDATLKLAADNYYKVWINDVLIGEEQTDENNFQLATQDTFVGIGDKLQAGSNTIKVEGKTKGVAGSSDESNPAGILFALYINYKNCGGDEPPSPPPEETVNVHIKKYIDGEPANSEDDSQQFKFYYNAFSYDVLSEGHVALGDGYPYNWTSPDLTQGSNGFSTWELTTVTDTQAPNVLPPDAQCQIDKFRLLGYTVGDSFAGASEGPITAEHPTLSNISDDKYIIIWNETCSSEPSIDLVKDASYATSTGEITFTINWAVNYGDVNDLVISDPVPVGMTFVSADNGGLESGSIVTWNLGNKSAGQSGEVSFIASLDAAASLTEWATGTEDNNQGLRKNGTAILADRTNPGSLLGAPQTTGTPYDAVVAGSFFSLGFDQGNIVALFDGTIYNDAGNDIQVYEVTGGTSYPDEKVKVEAWDGSTWVDLGLVNRDGSVDMGSLLFASKVRLSEASDKNLFENEADGYDLDAVGAVNIIPNVCDVENTASASAWFGNLELEINASASVTFGINPLACAETEPEPEPEPGMVSITVTKVLENAPEGTEVSDFTLYLNEKEVTSGEVNVVAPGTYTVTEEPNDLDAVVEFTGDCDEEGTIDATIPDEEYFCTITNSFEEGEGGNGDGGDGDGDGSFSISSTEEGGSHRSGVRIRHLVAGAFSSGPAGEVLGASTELPGLPNTGRAESSSNSIVSIVFALIMSLVAVNYTAVKIKANKIN